MSDTATELRKHIVLVVEGSCVFPQSDKDKAMLIAADLIDRLNADCTRLAQRNAALVLEIDKMRERNIELLHRNTRLLSIMQESEAREQ